MLVFLKVFFICFCMDCNIFGDPKDGFHLPSTVTVTYGALLKRRPNFRNTLLSKNLESRVTVSVLEAVDVHLSEKQSFMVIGEYLFFQILFKKIFKIAQ